MATMTRLYARTARGGQLNHVDILPPGAKLPADFDRCVRQVEAKESSGKHFFAVARCVQQAGGREGMETLVLHGVEVERLLPSAREAILHCLAGLQEDLSQLVTQRIDWDSVGGSALVSKELDEWLERVRKAAGGTLPVPSQSGGMWIVCMVVLAILVLVGGSVAMLQPNLFEKKPREKEKDRTSAKDKEKSKGFTSTKDKDGKDKPNLKDKEQPYAALAKRWKGSFDSRKVQDILTYARKRSAPSSPARRISKRLSSDYNRILRLRKTAAISSASPPRPRKSRSASCSAITSPADASWSCGRNSLTFAPSCCMLAIRRKRSI